MGSCVALILAALASGPLFPLQPRLTVVDLPLDLDVFLVESERRVGRVKVEQEKRVFWADPATRAKTPLALVYIHGFSASRGEISPVPEDLARELGANLFMTRLTAHGL
ncbi:MAG: hypothetical protein NDI61_05715, partial [Bdellovibrionaceae bacterium]|nr:hypothetical protein [Pseudobdellovibrionaceae bacterium]